MDIITQSTPLHCPSCGQVRPGPAAGSQLQPGASASTSELQKLLGELDSDLKRLLGRQKGKIYSDVKVLFLNWKECNLDPQVRDETIQLQKVLRESYHFDAGDSHDIYQIPSRLSADELEIYIQKAILDFKKVDAEQDKLMIVYYNGHGGINPKTRGLMIAGGMPKQKAIAFSDVQRQLEKAEGIDVLLLMDCCYAARTIKSEQIKAMEVLAAVSREVTAGMDIKGSLFTTALTKHLQACASQPNGILISELANLMHHDSILDDQSPQYIPLMGHHNPIILQPLRSSMTPQAIAVQREAVETSDRSEHKMEGSDTRRDTENFLGVSDLRFQDIWTIGSYTQSQVMKTILDSGSEDNFITRQIVERAGLSTAVEALKEPLCFLQYSGIQMRINSSIAINVSKISDHEFKNALGGTMHRRMVFYIVEDEEIIYDSIIGKKTIWEAGLINISTQSVHASALDFLKLRNRDSDAIGSRDRWESPFHANRDRRTDENHILMNRITEMQLLIRDAIQESSQRA